MPYKYSLFYNSLQILCFHIRKLKEGNNEIGFTLVWDLSAPLHVHLVPNDDEGPISKFKTLDPSYEIPDLIPFLENILVDMSESSPPFELDLLPSSRISLLIQVFQGPPPWTRPVT